MNTSTTGNHQAPTRQSHPNPHAAAVVRHTAAAPAAAIGSSPASPTRCSSAAVASAPPATSRAASSCRPAPGCLPLRRGPGLCRRLCCVCSRPGGGACTAGRPSVGRRRRFGLPAGRARGSGRGSRDRRRYKRHADQCGPWCQAGWRLGHRHRGQGWHGRLRGVQGTEDERAHRLGPVCRWRGYTQASSTSNPLRPEFRVTHHRLPYPANHQPICPASHPVNAFPCPRLTQGRNALRHDAAHGADGWQQGEVWGDALLLHPASQPQQAEQAAGHMSGLCAPSARPPAGCAARRYLHRRTDSRDEALGCALLLLGRGAVGVALVTQQQVQGLKHGAQVGALQSVEGSTAGTTSQCSSIGAQWGGRSPPH